MKSVENNTDTDPYSNTPEPVTTTGTGARSAACFRDTFRNASESKITEQSINTHQLVLARTRMTLQQSLYDEKTKSLTETMTRNFSQIKFSTGSV